MGITVNCSTAYLNSYEIKKDMSTTNIGITLINRIIKEV